MSALSDSYVEMSDSGSALSSASALALASRAFFEPASLLDAEKDLNVFTGAARLVNEGEKSVARAPAVKASTRIRLNWMNLWLASISLDTCQLKAKISGTRKQRNRSERYIGFFLIMSRTNRYMAKIAATTIVMNVTFHRYSITPDVVLSSDTNPFTCSKLTTLSEPPEKRLVWMKDDVTAQIAIQRYTSLLSLKTAIAASTSRTPMSAEPWK